MIVARTVAAGIKAHFVHRFSEFVFGWMMAGFAISLLAPGSTFASSASYSYMAELMTEQHWGLALLTVAGCRLFALIVNGSFAWFRPYSPTVRAIAAWFSAMAWAILAVSMYYGNPVGTGWLHYLILAVADAILTYIVAGEAGRVYTRHFDGVAGKR